MPGGVYNTAQIASQLHYSVTGSTSVPSGTPECRLTVTGSSPQTIDWRACNTSPFSHAGTPFAPGNRADWSGGYGLSTSIEGVWTFSVRITIDSVLYSASQSWSMDSTQPTVSLSAVPTLVNSATPSLPFSIVDANPGTSRCEITAPDGVSYDGVVCTNSFVPAALTDGTYRFWVRHIDATGDGFINSGFAYKNFTVDTTPPSVVLGEFDTPTSSGVQTFAFAVTGGQAETTACRHFLADASSPSAWGACSSQTSYGPFDLDDGVWTVEVKNTDAAGNTGIDARNIKIDTTAPSITVDSPLAGEVVTSAAPSATVSAVDPAPNTGVTELRCAYDDSDLRDCDDAEFLTRQLADGAHTLNVRAVDGVGNVGTQAVAFTVDVPAPPPLASTPEKVASVQFKRISGKTSGKTYRPRVRATLGFASAAVSPAICAGKAKLVVTSKLRGKSKTYVKQSDLQLARGVCSAAATFSLPKALHSRSVKLRIRFPGSEQLAAFDLSGSIKKL